MRSFLPFGLAALTLAAIATPASAQASFRASLATPAPAARTMVRETLWNCAGDQCRAARSRHSSDMTECRAMTRRLGPVAAFWAGERAFAADELARCNAGLATAPTMAAR